MSKAEVLLSTQDTPEVRALVEELVAEKWPDDEDRPYISYEHGQWWVTVVTRDDEMETYSVVDAAPAQIVPGIELDLEQVG